MKSPWAVTPLRHLCCKTRFFGSYFQKPIHFDEGPLTTVTL